MKNQIKTKNSKNNVTVRKVNNLKTYKVLGNLRKILINTEKRPSFDIKKIQYKFNLLSSKKQMIEKINKNNKKKKLKNYIVNISINKLDNNKTK